jgi:WD40 repeat protein
LTKKRSYLKWPYIINKKIAITSDNKYVVSGSYDKTLRVWNLDKKTQEVILNGHTSGIRSIAATSDNKYVEFFSRFIEVICKSILNLMFHFP